MHKVIFDTDPGVDDAMALLFLHRHPEVELLGVTTVFGNASIENTTRNALFLREAFGIDAPVARGADTPYDPARVPHAYPVMVHGENGLGDIPIPETPPSRPLDHEDAAQFIIDTVRAHPGEVSVVAVGRMTNLANALRRDPAIAGLVKKVVIMGGSFYVPGNVSPAAEANIHGDPEAADAVTTAPWKLTVIGLDVTGQTVMTRTELAALREAGGSDLALLDALSQDYISFYGHLLEDGMLVHDTCACVALVRPELFETVRGAVRVVCGGIADGQTILKPAGRRFPPGEWDGLPEQTVAVGVAASAVMALITETLARAR
jgi:purine nucleosidase